MARLRRDLAHARWLEQQVRLEPHWKLLAPVRLQTLVLRHEPPGVSGEALDAHTRALADAINQSGEAYLTPALIEGRWAIRVSLGSANTEQEHVAKLWRLLCKRAAPLLTEEHSERKITHCVPVPDAGRHHARQGTAKSGQTPPATRPAATRWKSKRWKSRPASTCWWVAAAMWA